MIMTTSVQNETILSYLEPYQPERVGIFGSWARGENNPASDLDILVKFSRPISLLTFTRLERELSKILNIKVDLVSENALQNERLKKYVLQDLREITA